jgi:CrcB protein
MSGALIAAVAAGGAIGAVLRVLALQLGRPSHRLPYATLAVNLTGSFLIGCVVAAGSEGPLWLAGLAGGVLGGFTTYSTFAVEAVKLSNERSRRHSALYLTLTLVGCPLAAGLGLYAVGIG